MRPGALLDGGDALERRPLEGMVVAVTGGGRGVGRAHALACARAGAEAVLVNDLGCDASGDGEDPSVASAVVDEIISMGARAVADHHDVGSSTGPRSIVEHTVEAYGRIDALISAAGVHVDATVIKLGDEALSRVIDVHVKGAFALARAASQAMIERGEGGSILLHTAPAAFFGAARQSALAATSAAVVGLVRSAAVELRKHRIRVNAIAPTARTRATEHLPLFQGIAETSMGPEFVGPVGAFLVSPAAAEVSGEVVGVAGTRIYALHGRETPGWFGADSPPDAHVVANAWGDITRS